jgi:hypothetical protein
LLCRALNFHRRNTILRSLHRWRKQCWGWEELQRSQYRTTILKRSWHKWLRRTDNQQTSELQKIYSFRQAITLRRWWIALDKCRKKADYHYRLKSLRLRLHRWHQLLSKRNQQYNNWLNRKTARRYLTTWQHQLIRKKLADFQIRLRYLLRQSWNQWKHQTWTREQVWVPVYRYHVLRQMWMLWMSRMENRLTDHHRLSLLALDMTYRAEIWLKKRIFQVLMLNIVPMSFILFSDGILSWRIGDIKTC